MFIFFLTKIYDHVVLIQAQRQFIESRQELAEKNSKDIVIDLLNKTEKEMSSRNTAVLAIFTALAFLIFGNVISIDNIFQGEDISTLRIVFLQIIWGFGCFNTLLIFFYFLQRILNLNLKDKPLEPRKISIFPHLESFYIIIFIIEGCFGILIYLFGTNENIM